MKANHVFCNIFVAIFLILCIFSPGWSKPLELKDSNNSDTESVIDPSNYYGNLSRDVIRKIQKCDRDMDSMELCMRCAKVTKSEIVYPMCCDNEDNVKDWCRDYIFFGVH